MFYNLIIAPIETIIDWVFNFITIKFSTFGIIGAVCGVSIVINFLALPLYNIADSLQEKERKTIKSLEPRIKRIKKAFKGNEQFMMLSTYYKENDYHPLYVLRSSLSILIEIPFFIAAYHYLSNCEALKNASFWIFKDLGSPDGLLHIGNFPIHILPVIMTLINFVSGAIYTKEAPLREKIQLYIVAALFLVLLYNSPSGLVIYWILNNLFSLVKNVVMKMKNPGKILHIAVSAIFLSTAIYFFTINGSIIKKTIFLIFTLIISLFPIIVKQINKIEFFHIYANNKIDFTILLSSGIGLTLLYGFLIPASVISTSPIEFSFLGKTASPLSYIYNSSQIFAGSFIIWPIVIYKLFNGKVSKTVSHLLLFVLLISLINTYVFKAPYGNLNSLLELDSSACLILDKKQYLLSLIIGIVIFSIIILLRKQIKTSKILYSFIIAICLGEFGVGCIKINKIKESFALISKNKDSYKKESKIEKEYNLSKSNKNVVVLFLDRAIDTFVPEIFKEFPDIEKQFSGFTYYPNTLSFSDFTIQGTPAMLGGYEYTQEQINERNEELLRDKHNESILVMPKIFSDAGFETTITDPPWPNYRGGGDLEFFKKYPDIHVSEIEGKYYSNYKIEKVMAASNIDDKCRSAFIDFATLQCLPPFLRITFYDTARRKIDLTASGDSFFSQLSNLYFLPQMTDVSSTKNTFTFIENEATHEVYVSLADDYESIASIQIEDNSLNHYQANVAAFKQIGKWLDYLRDNNVFDNTRIIIVSDHGRGIEIPCKNENVAWYSALFMFKDFNSNNDVITNYDFMTNADTLFLAKKDLPISNINPFTGKEFIQDKENGVNIYHCIDWNGEHYRNNKQFELDKKQAFHVSENIFEEKNWIPLTEWEKTNGGNN